MPDLEARLASLGEAIDWPAPGPRFAPELTRRLSAGVGVGRPSRPVLPWRRGVLVALGALLLLVAAAAAAGIVLPGLRIAFLPAGTGAPATPTVDGPHAGTRLGLGTRIEMDDVTAIAGFEPRLPAGLGAPAETYIAGGRLTLLWGTTAHRPAIAPDVGLLITQFRGDVPGGFLEKQVQEGRTRVEAVSVAGAAGYWLEGEPHALLYRDETGAIVEESRRVVGDVLLWHDGGLTLRIESGLGRDATIAIAETMTPAR